MAEFMICLLIGHIAGDYFFQPTWMALNKKKNPSALFLHCIVSSSLVVLITLPFFIVYKDYVNSVLAVCLWFLFVYISHAIIDGTGFVNWWLGIVKSRSYENTNHMIFETKISEIETYYAVAYTAIVQTVVDNTLHIILMLGGYMLLKKFFSFAIGTLM